MRFTQSKMSPLTNIDKSYAMKVSRDLSPLTAIDLSIRQFFIAIVYRSFHCYVVRIPAKT